MTDTDVYTLLFATAHIVQNRKPRLLGCQDTRSSWQTNAWMQNFLSPSQDSRNAMAAAGSRTREIAKSNEFPAWEFGRTLVPNVAVSLDVIAHSPWVLRRFLYGTLTGFHWVTVGSTRLVCFTAFSQLGRTWGWLAPGGVSYSCASYHTTSDVTGFRAHYHTSLIG